MIIITKKINSNNNYYNYNNKIPMHALKSPRGLRRTVASEIIFDHLVLNIKSNSKLNDSNFSTSLTVVTAVG